MKKRAVNESAQILSYLRTHDGTTVLDAFRTIGCTRLDERINDLKQLGYNIEQRAEKKNGKEYKKYSLIDED